MIWYHLDNQKDQQIHHRPPHLLLPLLHHQWLQPGHEGLRGAREWKDLSTYRSPTLQNLLNRSSWPTRLNQPAPTAPITPQNLSRNSMLITDLQVWLDRSFQTILQCLGATWQWGPPRFLRPRHTDHHLPNPSFTRRGPCLSLGPLTLSRRWWRISGTI